MSRRSGAVLIVVGVGALLAAAFAGFRPLPSPQRDQETCGSAFAPSIGDYSDSFSRDFFTALCSDDVSQAKFLALALAALAAVLVVIGVVVLTGARGRQVALASPLAPTERAKPLAESLERLAALHQSGALTDEEFDAAKRRALNPGGE